MEQSPLQSRNSTLLWHPNAH